MERRSFGKHISTIYRHQQIILNHELNPYGIGSGQYIFLIRIHDHEGINQKDLSKLIQIDKTTTTKAVKKLEDEGYIYRQPDPSDKRYNNLYLTEKGKTFIPILEGKLTNITKILSHGMTEEQMDLAYDALQLMLKNTVDAVEEIRKSGY